MIIMRTLCIERLALNMALGGVLVSIHKTEIALNADTLTSSVGNPERY